MTWLLVTRRPLWPSFGALGLFPGFHIAQFPFQVIGNCGVISLVQCSNRRSVKNLPEPGRRAGRELRSGSYSPQVFSGTVTPILGCRCVHYDGIVALAPS